MERLQNKKVYVGKHSKEIQEKAFELGFTWADGRNVVLNEDSPFLYFDEGACFQCGSDLKRFNANGFEEITAEEILSIKVEPKFKPDQLVLVRNDEEEEWGLNRYSHYGYDDSGYCHVCFGYQYRYCIPYEGNEHLLGTTNDK